MSTCWCRFVLAALVIVFAWWSVSWGRIALTILGALLAIMALSSACCCATAKAAESKPEEEPETPE